MFRVGRHHDVPTAAGHRFGFLFMQIKLMRPDQSRMCIDKRPGDDWVVDVLIASENEVYPVTVLGTPDEQEAVRDALLSFAPRNPDE